MKKNLKFIVLALIIISAIALWQSSVWQAKDKTVQVVNQEVAQENIAVVPAEQKQIPPETQINISFTFSENEKETIIYPLLKNNTKNLFTISQEIAREKNWDWQYQDYGEMGSLVTKINNTKNGQDNKYWQYYVNGEQPQISADKYIPKSDEKIEWRFAESTF